jgi:hypothetical protein
MEWNQLIMTTEIERAWAQVLWAMQGQQCKGPDDESCDGSKIVNVSLRSIGFQIEEVLDAAALKARLFTLSRQEVIDIEKLGASEIPLVCCWFVTAPDHRVTCGAWLTQRRMVSVFMENGTVVAGIPHETYRDHYLSMTQYLNSGALLAMTQSIGHTSRRQLSPKSPEEG